VDAYNNPAGEDPTNTIPVMDAEVRVQTAIDTISQARSMVGAQTVSLQEDANNASLQVVNQLASESAIRDADIAQETSAFVKDQVLAQIDLSVTSQMQVDAQLVAHLVVRASSVPSPGGGRA
jgi:flagellin